MIALALAALLAAPARPAQTLAAQAEVKASSGPVQLTLRIYKTRIRIDEGFWYQLELKNIGKEPFVVTDRILWDPSSMYLAGGRPLGIRFETRRPDGQGLGVDSMHHPLDCGDQPWPLPPCVEETPEVERLREGWRKEGVAKPEIMRRLIDR